MSDEQRLRDLLRAGLPAGEPPDHLWDRSRGRLHRARVRQRAAGALAAVLVVAGVGLTAARVLPRADEPGVVLDAPDPSDPATPAGDPVPPSTPPPTGPPSPATSPTPSPTPGTEATPDAPATPRADPAAPVVTPDPTACDGGTPLAGAVRQPVGDLDGDGEPDEVAVQGVQVQVVTSGGLTLAPFTAYDDAPVERVGVADADGDGDPELFLVSAGRAGERVVMARVDGCDPGLVINAQGVPYAFDVGERDGDLVGMGCVDVDDDGRVELVGLRGSLQGAVWSVDRTTVDIGRDPARNGDADTVEVDAADPDGVGLIRSATCGESLLDDARFP